jgi:hypothetical protein
MIACAHEVHSGIDTRPRSRNHPTVFAEIEQAGLRPRVRGAGLPTN